MQKILFNDNFFFTSGVLIRMKKMHRTLIFGRDHSVSALDSIVTDVVCRDGVWMYKAEGSDSYDKLRTCDCPRYSVGEKVAIARNYKTFTEKPYCLDEYLQYKDSKGWLDKRFVKAELMRNHIVIDDVRAERLWDITEQDAADEGIIFMYEGQYYILPDFSGGKFKTAREAYKVMFSKLNYKGAWDDNPWVYVYKFRVLYEE